MSGSPPMSDESSDTATPSLPDGVEIIKKPVKDWINPLMDIIRDAVEEKTGEIATSFQVLEITSSVARLINQHLDPLGAVQIAMADDHSALTPVPVGTHDPRLPPPPPSSPRAPGEIAAPGTLPSDAEPIAKPPPGDTKIQMNVEE